MGMSGLETHAEPRMTTSGEQGGVRDADVRRRLFSALFLTDRNFANFRCCLELGNDRCPRCGILNIRRGRIPYLMRDTPR